MPQGTSTVLNAGSRDQPSQSRHSELMSRMTNKVWRAGRTRVIVKESFQFAFITRRKTFIRHLQRNSQLKDRRPRIRRGDDQNGLCGGLCPPRARPWTFEAGSVLRGSTEGSDPLRDLGPSKRDRCYGALRRALPPPVRDLGPSKRDRCYGALRRALTPCETLDLRSGIGVTGLCGRL